MFKLMGILIAAFLLTSSMITPASVAADTVIVKNESDGTTYLTTEVVTDGSSPSATGSGYRVVRSTQVRSPLAGINIALPEGFAANFSGLFNGILSFVLVIAALLVFFFLIWGAFDWITSGGDKGKTDRAREKIVAAVIGLIIIASSYAILTLALRFLGFTDINDVFNSAGTIQGVPATPEPTGLEGLNATPSTTLNNR